MPLVTNTIKRPDGTAYSSGRVVIELAGENGRPLAAGYVTAGDYTIESAHTIETLTNGAWSATLVANSLINPSGTVWKITEQVDGRSTSHYVTVPNGAGPYVLEDILTDPPGAIGSSALAAHVADPDAHGAGTSIFDPVDYGAVYDGSTDDSAAINAAIDACTAAGGGIVQITATGAVSDAGSRVKISSDIVVKEGVWFRGMGPATTFTGAGTIRIPGSGVLLADRITISDFTMQSPGGVGVTLNNAGGTGGLQLGWPRITVENVTVVDPTGTGFLVALGVVIEARLINCVVMRPAAIGFTVQGTDNFLIGCTVGGSNSGGGQAGIAISGGNNKLTACKAYGLDGVGFAISGGGRHMLSACEAQDCDGGGFDIQSPTNSLAACVADTCEDFGFRLASDNNTVQGSVVGPGGGGTGMTTSVGVLFDGTASANVVDVAMAAYTPAKAGGNLEGNSVTLRGELGSQTVAYGATVTPDPLVGSTINLTLTGDCAIAAPPEAIFGHKIRFLLRQDSTGGRTVTFDSAYRTNSDWAPAETANTVDSIEFVYDGTRWIQTSVTLGITDRAGYSTTFTQADGPLPAGWTTSDGKATVVGNQMVAPTAANFSITTHAWRDFGSSDATVQLTAVNSHAFITFRVLDADDYYLWSNNAIEKVVAGSRTGLASGSLSFTAGDVLKVVCSGATFRFYKNGAAVRTVVDGTGAGRTKFGAGIAHSSGAVDDFSIA